MNGGTVTANGSSGAGIGSNSGGTAGIIRINGGIVTAIGGAIDTGVSGSPVFAGSAGIGGGDKGSSSQVIITGGSVNATTSTHVQFTNTAIPIGHGHGIDEAERLKAAGTLRNGRGVNVWLNTLTVKDDDDETVSNTNITRASYGLVGWETGYGTRDVKTDNGGRLYFYLSASNNDSETVFVSADDGVYTAKYEREANHGNEEDLTPSLQPHPIPPPNRETDNPGNPDIPIKPDNPDNPDNADIPDDPDNPDTPDTFGTPNTPRNLDNPDITDIPDISSIPHDSIIAALEEERPLLVLEAGDSTIISAESLQAIRESGKILQIQLANGLILTIDPASITDNAVSIDLHIDIRTVSRARSIDSVNFPANSIIITPLAHGIFGFAVSFDITAEQLAAMGLQGENLNLFHISDDATVTDLGIIKLNSDGSVTITIDHASYYILAEITEETPADPLPNLPPDDTVNDSVIVPNIEPDQHQSRVSPWVWAVVAILAIVGVAGILIGIKRRRVKHPNEGKEK
ncbi:MAG: hypothetical protein LBC96_09895 [Lachnospiraceae bacterium]|nr:hypothetical protein [Lachnospiraceae bacterium]